MASAEKSLNFVLASSEFVELQPARDLKIDLRYASQNNFCGRNLYGPFNRAFLHKTSAEMLSAARGELARRAPGFSFVIFDALRPQSVQKILWSLVVGTEGQKYFANPEQGSMHSFGFAIDLSLIDVSGRELDMGAGFDDFREISQPKFEERFLASGELSGEHLANRLLLRECMVSAGFIQLPSEWWHYDALPKTEVRAKYQIVD